MKIWIAQINTKVWDLPYNEAKIVDSIKELGRSADIIAFPELTTTGYPPKDLLFDEEFVREQKDIVYRIHSLVAWFRSDLKVILGFVDYDDVRVWPMWNLLKYNCAAIIGRDIKTYRKHLLPTYDVFAEKRYFESGNDQLYFKVRNEIASIMICEDLWDGNYSHKPIAEIIKNPIDTLFNISASPFFVGKQRKRFDLIREKINLFNGKFVYVNQVGAQDELVFDWWSFVFDAEWYLIYQAKSFEEDICIVEDTAKDYGMQTTEFLEAQKDMNWQLLAALKLGLKDYLAKSGVKKTVLWLSGGIDSAVCAYIISKVLDKKDYEFIFMPSKYSKSLEDAQALTANLWTSLNIIDISRFIQTFDAASNESFEQPLSWLANENTQARIRGNILMMRANQIWAMVINTSNKTEASLWYGTIYGDMIWWLGLIWDLNKKEVYALAQYINQIEWREVIPQNIIDKPASAELADDQVDPFDYAKISEAVDELLFSKNVQEVAIKYGLDIDEVIKYKNLIRLNEFKRRQSPPSIKVKPQSIWSGRLYPIA